MTVVVEEKQVSTPVKIMSDDPSIPIEVRRHIRNLHEGWSASPEKIAIREMNIILQDGQTWVDNYLKGVCAA